MIIDIILGNNIDTEMWVNDLRENNVENIIVIDYDRDEDPEEIEGVIYMTPSIAEKYIMKFDTKNFYKSMYVFPGTFDSTSSLNDETLQNKENSTED